MNYPRAVSILKEYSIANLRDRIQTWALEEARRRLEAEGILEDPDKTQRK